MCGDFACCWDNGRQDKYIQNWYNSKPWTTLFIDGNHENHDLLNSYPVEMWNGGKVHRISDKIIHLMRGQVFNIEGKTFFTMGGAVSQDRVYRTEGVSWWASEVPSRFEMEEAIDNLDNVKKVDYILTHCAPGEVHQFINPYFGQDSVTRFLEFIKNNYEFGWHYFGHYHIDKDFLNYKATCLYNNIIEI